MTHTILFFFFNDTATTEIYTLSLHDALPISPQSFSPSSELSTKSVDNPVENLLISPLITWCISTPIRSEGRHRGYPQLYPAVFIEFSTVFQPKKLSTYQRFGIVPIIVENHSNPLIITQ